MSPGDSRECSGKLRGLVGHQTGADPAQSLTAPQRWASHAACASNGPPGHGVSASAGVSVVSSAKRTTASVTVWNRSDWKKSKLCWAPGSSA